MKTKLRNLLFLLLLGILSLISPAMAEGDSCSTEQLENAKKQMQAQARTSCDAMKSAASAYNSIAASFISSCDPSLQPSAPSMPSEATLTLASAAGADIKDPELYKYRNVQWDTANVGNNESCEEKLYDVQDAYNKFNTALQKASSELNATSDQSLSQCDCNNEGHEPECHVMEPETEEVESQEGGCFAFTAYLSQLSNCPLCSIFETILTINADIAHIAWEATAQPLSGVVFKFFLVLLAFEVLKTVAAMGGTKPSALIKSVLILCLKFAIVIGLLSNSKYIYHMFLSPVIQGGLDMGLAITNSEGGNSCSVSEVGSISSQEFDPEVFNNILRTVKCYSQSAATAPAIGMGLMCHAFSPLNGSLFLSGAIMLIFGTLIWLAFSFYLIDATVQLGMLSAMVPLLIACWPFKMTQSYTTKGIKMLMSSFFTFTLSGVLMLIGSKIMIAALNPPGGVTLDDFMQALNSNNIKRLKEITSVNGLSILMMIACSIFALKMIANLHGLSQQLSGGSSGMKAGSKIGTIAASAAVSITKGGLHLTGTAAKPIAEASGDYLKGTKLGKGVTKIGNGIKKGRDTISNGAKSVWGNTWSGAGKLVGLGKYQNRNAGSGVTPQGAQQGQGRSATPAPQQPPSNNPPQPPG